VGPFALALTMATAEAAAAEFERPPAYTPASGAAGIVVSNTSTANTPAAR
jgi:hypothetical protein